MARAIRKGAVSFRLVIPVSRYPAGESAEEIGFRQLHRAYLASMRCHRM